MALSKAKQEFRQNVVVFAEEKPETKQRKFQHQTKLQLQMAFAKLDYVGNISRCGGVEECSQLGK